VLRLIFLQARTLANDLGIRKARCFGSATASRDPFFFAGGRSSALQRPPGEQRLPSCPLPRLRTEKREHLLQAAQEATGSVVTGTRPK
jgi:hypothetical protein